MIKNGYYYPNWIWKNKIHKNEESGEYEGSCVMCFIVGNREAGKTVGVGIYALNDFFKYKYKCALVRRYKDQFKEEKTSMKAFWNKCYEFCELANGHEITYKNNNAYIDGELFCYPISLSDVDNIKNESFDNVRTIIFDEFISESKKEVKKDGMNEFSIMLNIYETIARKREDALKTTSIIFISNSISKRNIYFEELGIDKELQENTKRILMKEKAYCVEIVNNPFATDKVVSSPLYKILSNTRTGRQYFGYSQDNRFKDNDDFIIKLKDKDRKYLNTFVYNGKKFSLSFMPNRGIWYISESYDPSFPYKIALTKDDHTMSTSLINGLYKKSLKSIKEIYENGELFFENGNCKKMWEDVYKII